MLTIDMEENIQYFSPTVMFRGIPCIYSFLGDRNHSLKFSRFFCDLNLSLHFSNKNEIVNHKKFMISLVLYTVSLRNCTLYSVNCTLYNITKIKRL